MSPYCDIDGCDCIHYEGDGEPDEEFGLEACICGHVEDEHVWESSDA